jgi:hypothetical protein
MAKGFAGSGRLAGGCALEPGHPLLKEREAFAAAIVQPLLIQDADLAVAILDEASLLKHSQGE